VRWIHEQEVEAVVHGYDWSANSLANNQTLVDIGGHLGTVLAAIAKQHPTVNCVGLDLPEVIASVPRTPPGVGPIVSAISCKVHPPAVSPKLSIIPNFNAIFKALDAQWADANFQSGRRGSPKVISTQDRFLFARDQPHDPQNTIPYDDHIPFPILVVDLSSHWYY
jgi:hypothetical protein